MILLGFSCLLTSRLEAQASDEAPSVADVEQAFVQLEYERAQELARAALGAGGHGPEQTARLYQLLGTSLALLGEEEQSYEAYRRQLAIQPDAEMDRSLSPALRTPFLRARGWWASQASRFGAQVTLGDPGPSHPLQLRVQLSDPVQMGASLVIRARASTEPTFREHVVPADRSVVVSLDEVGVEDQSAPEYLYSLEVRGESGNTLLAIGSDQDPRRAESPRSGALGGVGGETGPSGPQVGEEGWFWTIIGAVVAGGVTAGLVFGLPGQLNLQSQVEFGL